MVIFMSIVMMMERVHNRYKKKSFYWYKDVIESNGATLKAE